MKDVAKLLWPPKLLRHSNTCMIGLFWPKTIGTRALLLGIKLEVFEPLIHCMRKWGHRRNHLEIVTKHGMQQAKLSRNGHACIRIKTAGWKPMIRWCSPFISISHNLYPMKTNMGLQHWFGGWLPCCTKRPQSKVFSNWITLWKNAHSRPILVRGWPALLINNSHLWRWHSFSHSYLNGHFWWSLSYSCNIRPCHEESCEINICINKNPGCLNELHVFSHVPCWRSPFRRWFNPWFPHFLRSWDHATLRGHGRHATLTRRGLGPWPTVNAEMRWTNSAWNGRWPSSTLECLLASRSA